MSLDIDAYLERLGTGPVQRPDAESLRRLHAAHLERVPFENLDIAFGRPLSLDLDTLAEKIVAHRRGGFCYELNGLFAELLTTLGYEVTLLAAAVHGDGGYGPPLDHLALRVRCGDATDWLADVGFGRHSRYPLPWRFDTDLPDPDGTFRLAFAGLDDVVVSKDGVVQYRLETHVRRLEDFAAMCWYQQHSPDSHFTRDVVCSRSTADGRLSIAGHRLVITDSAGRHEEALADDHAVLDAYRKHFGIELDRVPAALDRAAG